MNLYFIFLLLIFFDRLNLFLIKINFKVYYINQKVFVLILISFYLTNLEVLVHEPTYYFKSFLNGFKQDFQFISKVYCYWFTIQRFESLVLQLFIFTFQSHHYFN